MLTENIDSIPILVVEDDENHAELIRRAFEPVRDEYVLLFAASLMEAQELIERQTIGLVLTDYQLPDGHGKELVSLSNNRWPVILMTAQGNEQLAVEAMKAGARDYLVKSSDTFSSMPRMVRLALGEWNLFQERLKIQGAISRGKREWEQTFDAVSDLIAIIDLNHNISRVNKAMARRFRLEPGDFPGRKCYELVHGLDSPPDFCPCKKMLISRQEESVEIYEPRENAFFDLTVSPLFDDAGQLSSCVHVARDITEKKNEMEERRKLEEQFQQTQKLESLGVLAGGIAHDFNNILTIILGYCYLSVMDDELNPEQRSRMQQIETASNRAADLCRQMLAYAGKNQLVQTRFELCTLLDELVKMLKSGIGKNIRIEMDLKHDVPEIKGDISQIQQIVMNLIINAAEAIGDADGTINVSLSKTWIGSETDCFGNFIMAGDYVRLEVSDNGCGMDEETRKRVFEPFFTTKFAGRGLGMSAILGIIKAHGGALKLSSEPGVGTTFICYFPLKATDDSKCYFTQSHERLHSNFAGNVLIVDDEAPLIEIGRSIMDSIGFKTFVALNGDDALTLYNEHQNTIRLVILDWAMPGMRGVEVYRKLREVNPALPVLFCSGCAAEEILFHTSGDDHAGLIQKPYNTDQLCTAILRLLD